MLGLGKDRIDKRVDEEPTDISPKKRRMMRRWCKNKHRSKTTKTYEGRWKKKIKKKKRTNQT